MSSYTIHNRAREKKRTISRGFYVSFHSLVRHNTHQSQRSSSWGSLECHSSIDLPMPFGAFPLQTRVEHIVRMHVRNKSRIRFHRNGASRQTPIDLTESPDGPGLLKSGLRPAGHACPPQPALVGVRSGPGPLVSQQVGVRTIKPMARYTSHPAARSPSAIRWPLMVEPP